MKEILTLQFGNYANYVGSHYWNQQESLFSYSAESRKENVDINHKILFRHGQNLKREETFTPRAVVVDMRGSLGALPQEGDLYNDDPFGSNNSSNAWNGNIKKHAQPKINRNEYIADLDNLDPAEQVLKKYKLNQTVENWSDFLKTFYHNRSICLSRGLPFHDNSETSFNNYIHGRELYKNVQFKEDLENKVHSFMEECDMLQGVQIFADIDDGFGGVLTDFMNDYIDDYGKKSVAIFSLTNSHRQEVKGANERMIMNKSISLNHLSSLSSNIHCIPLSLNTSWSNNNNNNNNNNNDNKFRSFSAFEITDPSPYNTSAVIASAIDTITLPCRKINSKYTFSHIFDYSSCDGRFPVLSTSIKLPVLNIGSNLKTFFDQNDRNKDITSLCPSANLNPAKVFTGQRSFRGAVPSMYLVDENQKNCSFDEIVQQYAGDSHRFLYNDSKTPLMIRTPFPEYWSEANDETNCMTSLEANSETGESIKTLFRLFTTTSLQCRTEFSKDDSLQKADLDDAAENLLTLYHNYHEEE